MNSDNNENYARNENEVHAQSTATPHESHTDSQLEKRLTRLDHKELESMITTIQEIIDGRDESYETLEGLEELFSGDEEDCEISREFYDRECARILSEMSQDELLDHALAAQARIANEIEYAREPCDECDDVPDCHHCGCDCLWRCNCYYDDFNQLHECMNCAMGRSEGCTADWHS